MSSSPQSQYIIQSAIFTADRLPGLDASEPVDIKGAIAELNIHESVELPYLTGSIALVDGVMFKGIFGIKGSERLEIAIAADKNSKPVIKKFMITGIAKNVSANERTDVYVLTLMEEHAYTSGVIKISEAYTGKPEEIILNIFNSHLNKRLIYDAGFAKQQRMKVNIPYWNPLHATEWLRDRMAAASGSPYFLYASFRDDNIRLEDLETLLTRNAWNEDFPYSYSQTAHNMVPDKISPSQPRADLMHVKSFSADKVESTLRLAQSGAIGSEFKTMDVTSASYVTNKNHDSKVTLNNFINKIDTNQDINSSIGYDHNLKIKNRDIGSLNSKVFSSVVSSSLFYEEDGKTPIAGYHEENKQEALYKLKIKSASLRAILLNNVFSITVPGQVYLIDDLDIGIGSTIALNYASPTQDEDILKIGDLNIDKDRSGKFLVYRTRHTFITGEGTYNVKMDIVKLTDKTSTGSV